MIKVKNKRLRISLEGLTNKQKKKVQRYANLLSFNKKHYADSREKIKKQVKKFQSSNIANKKKKFYGTALGVYKLRQKLDTQWNFYEGRTKLKGKKWKDLTPKQQLAFKKENEKLWLKYLRWNARRKAITQIKEDRKSAYENAKYQLRKRVVEYKSGLTEASKTWFIHRSTEESYRLNDTTQTWKETWVFDNYSDKLDEYKQKYGSEEEAIDKLIELGIKEGKLKELAQGVAYGYITEDYSEVISPP